MNIHKFHWTNINVFDYERHPRTSVIFLRSEKVWILKHI